MANVDHEPPFPHVFIKFASVLEYFLGYPHKIFSHTHTHVFFSLSLLSLFFSPSLICIFVQSHNMLQLYSMSKRPYLPVDRLRFCLQRVSPLSIIIQECRVYTLVIAIIIKVIYLIMIFWQRQRASQLLETLEALIPVT